MKTKLLLLCILSILSISCLDVDTQEECSDVERSTVLGYYEERSGTWESGSFYSRPSNTDYDAYVEKNYFETDSTGRTIFLNAKHCPAFVIDERVESETDTTWTIVDNISDHPKLYCNVGNGLTMGPKSANNRLVIEPTNKLIRVKIAWTSKVCSSGDDDDDHDWDWD
ncbi:MAG: hypothetical protein OCD01_09865 [Fibrobacterales bacterium]